MPIVSWNHFPPFFLNSNFNRYHFIIMFSKMISFCFVQYLFFFLMLNNSIFLLVSFALFVFPFLYCSLPIVVYNCQKNLDKKKLHHLSNYILSITNSSNLFFKKRRNISASAFTRPSAARSHFSWWEWLDSTQTNRSITKNITQSMEFTGTSF